MKRFLLFMVLVAASTTILAHGRGGRVHLGFHFGFPLYPSYWYYPPPPVYYYPVAPASPPVYVEREAQPAQNWWYYCEQTRGYYPYVKECPMGWTRVPPAPPPAQ